MTHKYIEEFLESKDQLPILLENCVLNITSGRHIIYQIYNENDYQQLEICYVDNHSDIIWKSVIKTKQELDEIILKTLE